MNSLDGGIVHVVMWRLADGGDGAAKAHQLRQALLSMEGLVPGLISLEVGVDTRRRANSFDVVLISRFADQEALEAYHDHPAHVAIKPIVARLCVTSIVVDYPAAEYRALPNQPC